jgi:hypothetical protein
LWVCGRKKSPEGVPLYYYILHIIEHNIL